MESINFSKIADNLQRFSFNKWRRRLMNEKKSQNKNFIILFSRLSLIMLKL